MYRSFTKDLFTVIGLLLTFIGLLFAAGTLALTFYRDLSQCNEQKTDLKNKLNELTHKSPPNPARAPFIKWRIKNIQTTREGCIKLIRAAFESHKVTITEISSDYVYGNYGSSTIVVFCRESLQIVATGESVDTLESLLDSINSEIEEIRIF